MKPSLAWFAYIPIVPYFLATLPHFMGAVILSRQSWPKINVLLSSQPWEVTVNGLLLWDS